MLWSLCLVNVFKHHWTTLHAATRFMQGFQADAVIHVGMHGTVEWLPGSPLGNTGLSWSDVLMGKTQASAGAMCSWVSRVGLLGLNLSAEMWQ